LDQVAGQTLGGERDQTLFERITAEYERYHTATGRERTSKDGLDAAKLRRRRDAAEEACRQVETRIVLMEERALRATALDQELAAIAARVDEATEERARLTASEEVRRKQAAAVEGLASELRAREAALREAQSANDALVRAEATVKERTEELAGVRTALAASAQPIAEAAARSEFAQRDFEAEGAALVEATRERDAAEQSLHLASAEFTAQTMAERLERLEQNEPERARVEEWLRTCRVDARVLSGIEQASERLTKLQARREAEGATIEVSALDGVEFQVNGKPAKVEAGRVARGTILGESIISLPGGVTITVRAGTAARELDAEIVRAQAVMTRALQAGGADSADAAHALLRERAAHEERLRGLSEQVKADLRDLGSVNELRDKLSRERARLDSLRAGETVLSIDEAKARRESAGNAHAAAEGALRDARAAADAASSALMELTRRRDQFEQRIDALAAELARAEEALREARERTGGLDLAGALRAAEAECDTARAALETARGALAEMHDESQRLESLERELAQADAAARRLSHERAGIQGVLEEAGAEGLQQRLVEAEQELTAATEELEAFLRRANAARALFEAMRTRRDEARGNYAGPLREKLEALGKLVFHPSFQIELTDDLRIARRTLHGTTLELSQLSVGVREQLAVLTRLACAALVSGSGGAPLVLDDIFGWADPGRLRKLGPILAEAASESQVLLFTCVPGRFEAVAPARVISLPSGEWLDRAGSATATTPRSVEAPPERSRHAAAPIVLPPEQPQGAFDLFSEEPAGSRR
jgi:DNA repair exonuclease SbcCD ATPase subunit